MEWISVKDRLPEFNQDVLIFANPSIATAVRHMCSPKTPDDWWWTGNCYGGYEWEWDFETENITHWMELPDPPKEENDDPPDSKRP